MILPFGAVGGDISDVALLILHRHLTLSQCRTDTVSASLVVMQATQDLIEDGTLIEQDENHAGMLLNVA